MQLSNSYGKHVSTAFVRNANTILDLDVLCIPLHCFAAWLSLSGPQLVHQHSVPQIAQATSPTLQQSGYNGNAIPVSQRFPKNPSKWGVQQKWCDLFAAQLQF